RDPREVCFDEVAPAVLGAAAPVHGFDLQDVEGDGDVDALLATSEGVEVWLQRDGVFERFATLAAPDAIGVVAPATGSVARIESVTAGDAPAHRTHLPTL